MSANHESDKRKAGGWGSAGSGFKAGAATEHKTCKTFDTLLDDLALGKRNWSGETEYHEPLLHHLVVHPRGIHVSKAAPNLTSPV